MGVMTHAERKEKFAKQWRERDANRFLWTTPNGESMATLSLRLKNALDTLHRECTDGNAIIVCHGEVIRGFQVLLERIDKDRYEKLDRSGNPHNRIHNCQVVHYTRRHPETQNLSDHYDWVRSVCPTDPSLSSNEWRPIERKTFSNDDLLESIDSIPQIIS